ncbi:MAG: orotate phosphoribosyltransferase [Aeropyrum sp.]|nr:orotate phosphoribosyltransferase [Aeropyrum sp.]MCE4616941.1 orotate phosphoribosyltransferase [Aeropyrum sp.]
MEDHLRVLASALLKRGAVLKGRFTLSSGRKSDIYVDARRLLGDPLTYTAVIDILLDVGGPHLRGADAIIGVATGGIPWASLIASRLSKPIGYVRIEKKGHGTMGSVEGSPPTGKVVLVDDVATTGRSLASACRTLSSAGYTVTAALVIVDRGEGARERLREAGVELVSVAHLSDILRILGW